MKYRMLICRTITTLEFWECEARDANAALGSTTEAAAPRTIVATLPARAETTFPYPGITESLLADLGWHLEVARRQGYSGTRQELAALLGLAD